MKKAFHFSLLLLATLVSLAVAYLFLDWPSSADVASTDLRYYPTRKVQAAQLSPTEEFTICTEPDSQEEAAIYGNVVIWTDRRGADPDIYGYDLGTKTEFTICTEPDSQAGGAIYGNIVVWRDRRDFVPNDSDIYGYDLSSGQEFTVCTTTDRQESPAIYGDIVVWEDNRDLPDPRNIYGYDLSSGQEFTVCTAPDWQQKPAIYGNVVVWIDQRSGTNFDIYGYDLSTGQEFTVCTAANDQAFPDIYGRIVVWHDRRSGDFDIYGYDLDTKTEFTICTATDWQRFPAIYGHVVVWQDYRNGTDNDIYGYDLNTGQEFTVCTATAYQDFPDIYSNVVVWWDRRNHPVDYDIYGAWLLADLSASYKAVDATAVIPGGVLTYTIVLSNPGSVPSFFTHLTDTVPLSTTYLPGSLWASSGLTEAAGNEIRWRGVISEGTATTVSYRVTVSSTVAPGALITNAAYVDDGYAPFWTNVVTTVGNVEVNLPVIVNNQTTSAPVQ